MRSAAADLFLRSVLSAGWGSNCAEWDGQDSVGGHARLERVPADGTEKISKHIG